MDWFTADLHLGHENIIKYCNRPFSSAGEMDIAIVTNILSLVRKRDRLFCLGDLSFSHKSIDFFHKKFRNSGIDFHFIPGNHDRLDKYGNPPDNLKSMCKSISRLKTIKSHGQRIVLCHFPMLSWDCSHHGSWQLYGHHHENNISNMHVGKQMCVSVDQHNFFPVSYDQVKEYMETQPVTWNMNEKDGKSR